MGVPGIELGLKKGREHNVGSLVVNFIFGRQYLFFIDLFQRGADAVNGGRQGALQENSIGKEILVA